MGNDPNKYISLYIDNEKINQVLDEQKRDEFYKYYQQFSSRNGFLSKNDLSKLTKIDNEYILEKIFDIFASKKGKMYFSDLICFFTSFKNEQLKVILLAFLLFGRNARIGKKAYIEKLNEFMVVNDNFIILNSESFLISIISNEKGYSSYIPTFAKNYIYGTKDKDTIYYDKSLFINKANNLIKQNILKFNFVYKVIPSSKLNNLKIDEIKKKVHTYVCDCLLQSIDESINASDELEGMKYYFNRDNSVVSGHMPFSAFEKIMKELRVNQKLIDIIITFLKNHTMKDYINFQDFKNLMSNIYYRVSYKQKKKSLFKMLLTISNEKSSIEIKKLAKILKIENKEFKPSGTIDENSFESLKDPIINSEIETYIGYMDNLGLMPYLKFNVKPLGQELKKKIINFILCEKTAEEYLIENFDSSSTFYPINIEFWKSLIEPGRNPEFEVNNSIIADVDEIYYIEKEEEKEKDEDKKNQEKDNEKKEEKNENEQNKKEEKNEDKKEELKKEEPKKKEAKIGKLKKNLEYGKDFVIICGDLYQKVYENFEFDYIIKLTKITKYLPNAKQLKEKKKEGDTKEPENKEIAEKLEINKEKNYLCKKGNEKEGIKEYVVDFYPIKIIQLSMKNLIDFISKEKEKIIIKKEEQEWKEKSDEEKIKIVKEKQRLNNIRKEREQQYMQKLSQLQDLMREDALEQSLYDEKVEKLKEAYKDLFTKEKKEDKIKLKKSEFLELLKKNLNYIIFNQKSRIQKQSRFSTAEEIKNILIYCNQNLNENNFDLLYFTFENEYIIPKDETSFNDNGIDNFDLVVVDIKNEEGESYLSILEKNENEIIQKEEKKEIDFNNEELKDTEILSKEELEKIKENMNQREKLRKQQEKIEREKYEKMEKEKLEQLKKEKEDEKKKEKEKEKEREKEISPPYGIPNFGNTCYFNSVNQIFFNLPIMQQLFMNEKLKYFINKNNKFGYKGKFILTFMLLYKLKPSKIDDYAQNLKTLVGKLKDTFNNRDQQDANEYLNFVLEALHEELNIKTSKRYIEDKDENYKYNTEEELGNIAWANNLRRNVSFIDSIFMFQLKSNLTCKRCGTKKYNFETNYVLDLPLSLCKMVTVVVELYRLPFKYKIYFDKINKNFSEFTKAEENKNKDIVENLMNYYTVKLSYEQKQEHLVNIHFEFDFQRQKSIGDLIKILRNISLLQLEPEDYEVNINNQDIAEYKINHFTEFLVFSSDKGKLIKNDEIIDKFVDINDRIQLNIYEILNTKGFNKINQDGIYNICEFNLFSYKIKKKGISKLIDYKKNIEKTNYYNQNNDKINSNKEEGETVSINSSSTKDENEKEENSNPINIISLNDKLTYYEEEIIDNKKIQKKFNKLKINSEYIIPIVHFRREINPGRSTLFVDFYYSKLRNFPQQFLVFNNSNYNQITPKYLYNYIWDYNSLYMNHPNKATDKFWFNVDPKTSSNIKVCYPFVIRIVKKNKIYSSSYNCAKCQWYNFCIGCILYPNDDKYVIIESDSVIYVDWCNSLIKEEIESFNFNKKNYSSEEIMQCIESSAKNDKSKQYQSIKDCFELFFEKELLEDPLSCRICGGQQYFFKNYEINKLPYVLILSLKRFKYNENNNFKLKQLITYPIFDFELKDKKYDLFGVINHYGGINSGHYTCFIKYKDKWIACDDRRVFEIDQERVMNSNAYILFYISKESINSNSYYNSLSSLMQHIVVDKNQKEYKFIDNNYFKGEPVCTDYGEGYVEEDSIEDFKIEKNINGNNKEDNEGETKEVEKNNEKESEIKGDNDNDEYINKIIKVKFDFGKGMIYKGNVKKQISEDK